MDFTAKILTNDSDQDLDISCLKDDKLHFATKANNKLTWARQNFCADTCQNHLFF